MSQLIWNHRMTTQQQHFRSLMGRMVTGVTVIATQSSDSVFAMTANAVTSVSLEPLILLACIRNESRMLPVLLKERNFSVNILAADQDDVSRHYSGKFLDQCPASWQFTEQGTPLLEGANASFSCVIHSTQKIGDHTVVYGQVDSMCGGNLASPALVYASGRYANLPLAA
jgi:flavin reductase (DIM6/NTAB) family NADH-FMN oxidoreductase RutF